LSFSILLFQVRDSFIRQARWLSIGPVQFIHVAVDALLELLHASLEFALSEVFVSIVDRFKFAAVDGYRSI
jgi:hypothetical protein